MPAASPRGAGRWPKLWLLAAAAVGPALPRGSALSVELAPEVPPQSDVDQWGAELIGAGAGLAHRLGLDAHLSFKEVAAMVGNYNRSLAEAVASRAPPSTEQRLPMVYLHVHKSLGTWMCKMARAQNASRPGDADCATHDDWIWAKKSWEWYDFDNTCSRRVKEIQENGWTFLEIERWVDFQDDSLHGDWCPEDAFYTMILRDPMERAQSQMYANMQSWASVRAWLAEGESWPTPYNYLHSHIPFDNFYVRTLCGRTCHFLEAGGITHAHLELAKSRLQQLDAVMTTEDLLTQLSQLTAITGWRPATKAQAGSVVHNTKCAAGTSRLATDECRAFALPPSAMEQMRDANRLDLELYEFAKQVAKQKTDALL
ncbi:unnamed protein product [Prorocentrum cordatum]|uniref:Sulfotransferase n=1 Tax=Prorocentrum cordatum TaxID=2364126 RepID=A0ABN9Q204_9DINO|nr:unnamed protein product [Polarella glacialis]